MDKLKKYPWIDRVLLTESFHRTKCQEADSNGSTWRVSDTAKALGRSLGRISEDLTLASWLKTHSKELEKFRHVEDALEFVRNKKREIKLGL